MATLRAERFFLIPIIASGICLAIASRESYYRVYYTQYYLDKARGVRHDGPGVDAVHMRIGGVAASAFTFVATTSIFKNALYKILLSPRPSHDKLFDTIVRSELPPPLPFQRFGTLFGPATAQPNAFNIFFRTYGGQAFCVATAAGWGLFLAPIAHARAEAAIAEMAAPVKVQNITKGARAALLQKEAEVLGLGELKSTTNTASRDAMVATATLPTKDAAVVQRGGAAAALGAAPGAIFGA